ncbi:MAG: ABC transporter permease [Deltaproteobacteria bacterium]|nr:ABC transporter permease [Deltaproteobacteria bacterium]
MIKHSFKVSKLSAIIAGIVLLILYSISIFAPYVAPYPYKQQNRAFPDLPPTSIHFTVVENGKTTLVRPYVYRYELTDIHAHKYSEVKNRIYPIRFFTGGKLFYVKDAGIHLLGTDQLGRDYFSRLVYGGRVSLFIGLIGALISFSIGIVIGTLSGYIGGIVDTLIMRFTEIIMSLPAFYFLLTLAVIIPAGVSSSTTFMLIIVILSFIGWAGFARVIRGIVLSIKERDFIIASRAYGDSIRGIILKQLIPNLMYYTVVAITLSIPGYIISESALSMLGLGIRDPDVSWGNMLSEATNVEALTARPWMLASGIAIIITILCLNILGDYLRSILDPRTNNHKA